MKFCVILGDEVEEEVVAPPSVNKTPQLSQTPHHPIILKQEQPPPPPPHTTKLNNTISDNGYHPMINGTTPLSPPYQPPTNETFNSNITSPAADFVSEVRRKVIILKFK